MAGRLTKIRDLDFIVPRERRVVDAYINFEICQEEDQKLPAARIGDFVDLAQNSSQNDLSLQQAGGSRTPPLNASTA